MGDSLLSARRLRQWNEMEDEHAGFMFKRNVPGNPRRLQQFEMECAPRIHGWTCDQSLAQVHSLSCAAIFIFCKSRTSRSDSTPLLKRVEPA